MVTLMITLIHILHPYAQLRLFAFEFLYLYLHLYVHLHLHLYYICMYKNVIPYYHSSVLANYLVWNVIQDEVSFLSKPYRDARTKYKDSVLGSKGQKKRWKTCVSYANELTGDILGAAYVRKHFDQQSKEMVSRQSYALLVKYSEH